MFVCVRWRHTTQWFTVVLRGTDLLRPCPAQSEPQGSGLLRTGEESPIWKETSLDLSVWVLGGHLADAGYGRE